MKMQRIKFIVVIAAALLLQAGIYAQKTVKTKPVKKERGAEGFPELIFTDIPGAPKLSTPFLIKGSAKEVIAQGYGWAAPAYYDWDGDGLKDLLIGEFGSGIDKDGKYMGNFVRVYKNEGTAEDPRFSGIFQYARPSFEILTNGTPFSVDQFCCLGFTPQFIDLNGDGRQDMITGTYYGEVIYFQNSVYGFQGGKAVSQMPSATGYPRTNNGLGLGKSKDHQYYWLFASASFGDFTNDGKPDLITGGRELRMSKNIGTISEPEFAQRQPLLDTNGNPLKVYQFTEDQLKSWAALAEFGYKPPESGDDKLAPYAVDWDQDGTLDILVTNSYGYNGFSAVDFFKGVQTKDGYRFLPAVPLFTAKNGGKALPGRVPYVFVTDWNNDGIHDLLIGVSVVTMNNKFNDTFSWNWEADTGIEKNDPAFMVTTFSERELNAFKIEAKIPKGITWEDYITIRHQGYVYVMLGRSPSP